MINFNELEKLKSCKLNSELLYSVYKYNGKSLQELLCEFFKGINGAIENSNAMLELAKWLVQEGLSQEVIKQLNIWKEDGTIADIINEQILDDLKEKIETIENGLTDVNQDIEELREEIENIKNSATEKSEISHKFVEDFGAVGDGITDDRNAIQKAIDWARNNDASIYFHDKRYYVGDTLDVGNARLRGISDTAGDCDVLTLLRKDGTYMNGTPHWGYMSNTDDTFTWRDVMNECAYGCCIISDIDKEILFVGSKQIIDIRGIAIIGDHNKKNQVGIYDMPPTEYYWAIAHINNVTVVNCGGDGIQLNRGLETCTMSNLKLNCNNGYGLYVGHTGNVNCPQEYVLLKDCYFANNRKDNVHFSKANRNIELVNCRLNGGGQYYFNAIDPILNYNRKIPTNVQVAFTGLKVRKNPDVGALTAVKVMSCYAEECFTAVYLDCDTGGSSNSLVACTIEDCNFMPTSYIGQPVPSYLKPIIIDCTYMYQMRIKGNYWNDIGSRIPVRFLTSDISDGGENYIPDCWEGVGMQDFTAYQPYVFKNGIKVEGGISANKVIHYAQYGDNDSELRMRIDKDFNADMAQGTKGWNWTAVYVLAANTYSGSAYYYDSCLITVSKVPNGQWIGNVMFIGDGSAFREKPYVDTAGGIVVKPKLYYSYTLTRIDMQKTN